MASFHEVVMRVRYYDGLIGNRIGAFDLYQNQGPWMAEKHFSGTNRFVEPTRKIFAGSPR